MHSCSSHPKSQPKQMALLLLLPNKSLSLAILCLLVHHVNAGILSFSPITANCTGGNYTDNSIFSTNLNSLLSTFNSKSSSSNSTYQISGTVYGLFFCTGDLSQENCQACIQSAIKNISEKCPSSKQAIIWYDYCELRYSDTNFFGFPDTNGFSMINPYENTSSSEPMEVMSQLVKEAPSQVPVMFSYRALPPERLYALAQCSPDLTAEGCSRCLTTILANIKACCTMRKGWRYLATSCWIRYEATPFLQNLQGVYIEVTQSSCPYQDSIPNDLILNDILSDLMTNTPLKGGFYNTSEGETMNKLYGLALCRGDLAPQGDSCETCLQNARNSILEDCTNKTQAIECNQIAANITTGMVQGLIRDAVNSPTFLGVGKIAINSSLESYALVQCTRDLSREGCEDCL
ncbi:cysteine-rich repeat secretory protein 38-like [Dioscorea cayenensis subsp. rotundata]|uniref:Cysteine-rich repeat secretory protein 38-like n=1 Tax=Dioscorea cayennensis subsp. rotundata TaxID=55577 RepID=A0AB40B418_DIOCR|nr:cysteine-rich repeat secretory protein 38-like [Dioscorea cayenensis subsp. rotundata]